MDKFTEHFAMHVGSSLARQMAFSDFLGKHDWWVDFNKGVVTFRGDLTFPAQLLGSESYGDNTWLWAWANTMISLPPDVLRRVAQVREYGEQLGIPELVEGCLPLGRIQGHMLAMLCSGLLGGLCYYRGPYDGGAVFFLVEDVPSSVTSPVTPERAVTIISEVISQFALDHRLMAESFIKQQGFSVEQTRSGLEALWPDGSKLSIEFDSLGRIAGLDTLLLPRKKPSAPWQFWKKG